MLPIVWTEAAADDLFAIVDYISQFNPIAARHLRDRIEGSVAPLSNHPYLFKRGRAPGTRELVAHPNYLVVYRVLDDSIEIANVLHARQKYP